MLPAEILSTLQGSSQITPPPRSTSGSPCPREESSMSIPASPVDLSTLSVVEEALRKSFQSCGCHLLPRLPVATTSNGTVHLYPLPIQPRMPHCQAIIKVSGDSCRELSSWRTNAVYLPKVSNQTPFFCSKKINTVF